VRERTFHQGDMLTREGDVSSHFKIIKIGMVFLCRNTAGGAPRPVAVSGRGTAFGIFGYMAQPNQVSVVAASSGRYCEIATEKVRSLSGNDRTFRRRLEKIYVDTVAIFAGWAEAMGRGSVNARVAAALLLLTDSQRSTAITIPSHSALAEMLGTTRESVARALAALEAGGGVIRKSPRRCEVFPGLLRERLAAAK
jgi:CRP-like cAMP-binding protein